MAQTNSNNPTIPHYALPSIASKLPDYTNYEQESIRAAFAPNTYKTISQVRLRKDLGNVEGGENMLAAIDAPPFRAGNGEKGLFSEFMYESSPYDVLSTVNAMNREHNQSIQKGISEKPFVIQNVSSTMYGRATSQVNSSVGDSTHDNTAGESPQRDPYDAVKDDEFRTRWLEEHRSKPFLPGGKDKPLTKPTRAMLTDIMTHLYRVLCEDWSEAHPTVLATSEDLIVMYFSREGIKNEAGIQAYMGVFARRNDIVLSYDLRRVNEGWNVTTGDGHLMFTFRPPWVRQRSFLTGAAGLGATNSTTPK
eukprot:PhF_6_TR15616/c0_g1_i1/m.24226